MGHNTDVGTRTLGPLQESKMFIPDCVRTEINDWGALMCQSQSGNVIQIHRERTLQRRVPLPPVADPKVIYCTKQMDGNVVGAAASVHQHHTVREQQSRE